MAIEINQQAVDAFIARAVELGVPKPPADKTKLERYKPYTDERAVACMIMRCWTDPGRFAEVVYYWGRFLGGAPLQTIECFWPKGCR